MLKQLLTRFLNHVIAQNSWAKAHLQPYGGKAVRFNVFPLSATLTVLEDGGLAISGVALAPEATVNITPGVALRLIAGDQAANTLITIEGDTELATAMAKVLHEMSWDVEEDLSHVIGDTAAHQAAKLGRKVGAGVKRQTINVAEMVTEYWQEEIPLLAKKRHVEQFIQDVDVLREDAERLQKRFDKLSAHFAQQSGQTNSETARPKALPNPASTSAKNAENAAPASDTE